MSAEWATLTIGELVRKGEATVQTGPFGSQLHSHDYVTAGTAVIPTEAIGRGRILDIAVPQVDSMKAVELARHRLRLGDILFARRGAQATGLSAIIDERFEGALCGTGALLLRIRSPQVDPNYLAMFLSSEAAYIWLRTHAVGAVMPNLNTDIIKGLPITLPGIEEQRSLARFLGAIDDRITLLRETNATLEAIAQTLFKSWFVDFDPVRAKMDGRAPEGLDTATALLFPDSFEESELGLVPRGWRVHRLGEATERITKGTTPTTLKRPFVDAGINFVKAESMTGDGGFIPEKFAFIDGETHELLRRSQLQDGDVLISIAGTIGRIAVMTKDFLPANTNQAVALVRPLPDIFPSGLINRFLRLSESQQRMREKVVQAVQANLSLGTLSDLKVVVPPDSIVSKLYESGLAQIDASWTTNDQRVRTLATLRDTLLPRLISGQLRLNEIGYEN